MGIVESIRGTGFQLGITVEAPVALGVEAVVGMG
jgi:hypothetical protein